LRRAAHSRDRWRLEAPDGLNSRSTGEVYSRVVQARWLFLAAYACSGLAGLIYQVAWVRMLTLYMGHTTAATSTVVAAFMGGMAAGSAIGGRVAARLSPRHALLGYALLEGVVIAAAILLPVEIAGLTPALQWAYRDGDPGLLFPAVRLLSCLAVLIVPTLGLGATFPLAVRWIVSGSQQRTGESAGGLYAANTAGAAIGMLAAGFLLIPTLGVNRTTVVGVAASAMAIAAALVIAHTHRAARDDRRNDEDRPRKRRRENDRSRHDGRADAAPRRWLASAVLASTGFATFLYEMTWTRVFSTIIGPSTYAFVATVAGIIAGLAIGSGLGALLTARVRRPELPLALALLAAAVAASWASAYAAATPLAIAERLAAAPAAYGSQLFVSSLLAAALVAPAAVALGLAFPLALEIAGGRVQHSGDPPVVANRLGGVYAINTLASVAGSLAAGFVLMPNLGFQSTLRLADVILIGGAVIVLAAGSLSPRARLAGMVSAAAAAVVALSSPRWDRELLASGGYKYASYVPKGLDLATALTAGTLLYYKEGPTGIVTVKRLAGNVSLAIDGKVDASTSSDMLTQKILAHLPLLLHGHARTICIIGLGSGVTLASALAYPIGAADVIEISPEVVEASRFFEAENHRALEDPRTRLIVGDGRSHLALSSARYDLIISEPSNPWMAGVAALFTREFFAAVRDRLAPDGIVCQWAHTYDISAADLRSIVRTFAAVFPHGMMWLVGNGDLLLVGSAAPLEPRLDNIAAGWTIPAVAADLASTSMHEPFALMSMFVGGPSELDAYGAGAAIQTDDRMALEFSGPRAINDSAAAANTAALQALVDGARLPPAVARARATAGARQWRDRGLMMLGAGAHDVAYEDFVTASRLDPADRDALSGLVRAAVPAGRQTDAAAFLASLAAANRGVAAPRIALSNLHGATGAFDAAVAAARDAMLVEPIQPQALDQLASLYADAGDAAALEEVVEELRRVFPMRATTRYYEAAARFLRGDLPTASALAQQSIEMEPTAASHNLLGAIRASLGQSDPARASFEAALVLDARDSAAYTNLALLELQSGNAARAAGLFAEALSIDPASGAAREGLAQARAAASGARQRP
jgi:spermidine synthase